MTEEQDRALVADFPLLYRDRNSDLRQSGMAFGFQVGPGWYAIIRELSHNLENQIKKLIHDNPGVSLEHFPAASQVKEKFGTLRFYMTTYSDEMDDEIENAVRKSRTTCEECGNLSGKMNAGPWLAVRCKEHWQSNPSYEDIDKYYQDQHERDYE